ncbi:nucleotidyltransferase family protein [Uliginosibacterium paludis]|uniref:Nucleotidyltransferase family protein n=1 Tax=Uliginosibacterium paludis TaxID=1615952 RepID=A0ABV2CUY4_9RHOO
MQAPVSIFGLLLAAGSARRFGGNKLLERLPDGEPVLLASARKLAAATDRCIVLLRPAQHAERELLHAQGIEVLEVPDAGAGMGVTLARGVQATPGAGGWLVALADMPCIRDETLRYITRALREGAPLAAPFHQGRRGHPVGFSTVWQQALMTLEGDEGARHLLRAHQDSITHVPVNDPGCLFDIDTPGDLRELSSGSACA